MSARAVRSTRAARWLEKAPPLIVALACLTWITMPASGQSGAKNAEWRYYGGDAGSTKYSPLDQINKDNVKGLQIVWRWKAENFGPRADFNYRRRR